MKFVAVTAWILAMVAAFYLGRSSSLERGPLPSGADLQAALDQTNPLERATQLSRYLEALGPANVDETAEIIERNHRFYTQPEHLLLMTAWTRFDPEGALAWASSREGRLQKRATLAAVEAVALGDSAAALAWVEGHEDLSFDGLLHEHLVLGWARSDDLDGLTEHLIGIRQSQQQESATMVLAIELMRRGSDGLTAWAESIPDDAPGGFKKLAFHKTASALAIRDPAEAGAWLQEFIDEDYGQEMTEYIARRWAAREWHAALNWLVSLPPSEERAKTTRSLFGDSLKRKPERAEAWAQKFAPDEGVDTAIRVIIQRDYWERPADALAWALLLSDEKVRREVQLGVGRSWHSQKPEEFQVWLTANELEQGVEEEILASF